MGTLARKLIVNSEENQYIVALWIGHDGCRITVTEDSVADMLIIGRKVRQLARWLETDKGRAKLARMLEVG